MTTYQSRRTGDLRVDFYAEMTGGVHRVIPPFHSHDSDYCAVPRCLNHKTGVQPLTSPTAKTDQLPANDRCKMGECLTKQAAFQMSAEWLHSNCIKISGAL